MKNHVKNKIMRLIEKKHIVSFDIFDTLVYRCVMKPSGIFDLVQDIYNQKSEYKIYDFREIRISAERNARNKNKKTEISLDDIYKEIYDVKEETKDILKSIEISTEECSCVKNTEIFKLYQYCLEKKKKIIVASDMYLDVNSIKRILKQCGYIDFYKIYVSSEIKVQKSSGALYQHILKDLDISPDEMVHIGDNFKSDYLRCKEKKISCVKIKKSDNHLPKKTSIKNDYLRQFVYYHKEQEKDKYYDFGYKKFGILLFGFCKWLENKLKETDIEKVMFFSREGKLISEAFNLISNSSKLRTEYLYVSRKSLRVPILFTCANWHDLITIYPVNRNISVIEYINGLGLNGETFIIPLSEAGFIVGDSLYNQSVEKLYRIVETEMIENSKNEFEKFLTYLKEVQLEEICAIVDIGWTGSMQVSMERNLKIGNINTSLKSYFLGQRPEMEKFIDDNLCSDAYLFKYNEKSLISELAISGCTILELLFIADHGSTEGYMESGGKIKPKLQEYEYEKVYPFIRKIQLGALQFIKDYLQYGLIELEIDNSIAFNEIGNFLRKPSRAEIKLFSDFIFTDGYSCKIVPKSSPFHPRIFILDFSRAWWKTAFLKYNLKIPLPYFKIYCLLRKIFIKI